MAVAGNDKRNDCRSNQYEYHHILELLQKSLQIAFLLLSPQPVRSVLRKPLLSLRVRQPFRPAAVQFTYYFIQWFTILSHFQSS